MPTVFEFFAGGGMARAGLGDAWTCLFSNDFDRKKAETYTLNWGAGELRTEDVRKVKVDHLPSITPDLVWASFPCQDLSLAGGGAGLLGERSGTFWPFWKLMKNLSARGRAPRIIVLENVTGTLTSHGGKDFAAIVSAYRQLGYRVGALLLDAEAFVPQSRPRLFFVGINSSVHLPAECITIAPGGFGHPTPLRRAYAALSDLDAAAWVWWNVPTPPKRKANLVDILEADNAELEWHSVDETAKILSMMSPLHARKLEKVQLLRGRHAGTLYRRTRPDAIGGTVQRAEIRFDNVAGCLRTPAGGSSRQVVVVVENGKTRSRLISARETARLMGLPDTYKLPARYNEAYHLTGDGVVVPVVEFLSENLLLPLSKEVSLEQAA